MTRLISLKTPAAMGAICMVGAGAIFALANTVVQFGTMTLNMPPTRLAFWQYALALCWALPWVLRQGGAALRTKQLGKHVFRVFLAAIGVQLWVTGLAHVPIWQAIALVMLSPFFVTIGAGLFLGEAITVQRLGTVLVGLAGGMIVLAPWSDAFGIVAFYPLGAAAFWAASSLVTKSMTRSESAETLTLYLLLLLTPINAGLAFGDGLWLESGAAMLVAVSAGALTVLAQFVLVKGYSLADAAFLQPFDHVKLVVNVALGIAVFGFVPPGSLWVGAALIVAASLMLLNAEGGRAFRVARP